MCVEHLNRCKTSNCCLLVFFVNCTLCQAGRHRRPIELCPTKLSMVSLGYPGLSPGRTCTRFETFSLSIFPTFVSGDRLSPEPACRSFPVLRVSLLYCTVVAICISHLTIEGKGQLPTHSSSSGYGDGCFLIISRVFSPTHSCQV